jgi:hypothetical protein
MSVVEFTIHSEQARRTLRFRRARIEATLLTSGPDFSVQVRGRGISPQRQISLFTKLFGACLISTNPLSS